ncbi:hypothetical protein CHK_0020 [Christensenella hongkongensis]|uniref:Uncharacterized protein n=1 Tax=Christensenella hongkongensis TaxID=270498 RepID=A0A0M2NQI1_9FIRM|nr:hypothetical protein CHK_1644 [Christensenella hongkongensis]KKI52465.1 hypothetical protein CHK_0020 [Christensenella hongkongensis]
MNELCAHSAEVANRINAIYNAVAKQIYMICPQSHAARVVRIR